MFEPQLVLVAGPNGAGKSTFTQAVVANEQVPVLDPDAIARRLDPLAAERHAVAAGREVVRQRNILLAGGVSLVIETTLAGVTTSRHIAAARKAGYSVHLVYVCVAPVELCLRRIAERVEMGGHAVPENDVRRRYERSLANLQTAVRLADIAQLFDNSGLGNATLVAELVGGQVRFRVPVLPPWLMRSLGNILSDTI